MKVFAILISSVILISCAAPEKEMSVPNWIEFADQKMQLMLDSAEKYPDRFPRRFEDGKFGTGKIGGWTSGFFGGALWYMFDLTEKQSYKERAITWTEKSEANKHMGWKTHDLGFMVYCPYGNALKYMDEADYEQVILQTSDSLVQLYNPNVGTILSWPWKQEKFDHNTIIDNLMNLEMLLWAANHGRPEYEDLVRSHLDTTLKYAVRPDYSTFHLVSYDSMNGQFQGGYTVQGHADSSTWARGQAWGIYGFTMAYRELQEEKYLNAAQNMAELFIENLPADHIPYWDFSQTGKAGEPRDVSAATIFLSAFLDLLSFSESEWADRHRDVPANMLKSLWMNYRADDGVPFVLGHSTGHRSADSEVDVPLIYSDYYFLEALTKMNNEK